MSRYLTVILCKLGMISIKLIFLRIMSINAKIMRLYNDFIKSNVSSSLVSAYSFGQTSLRPTGEGKDNRL